MKSKEQIRINIFDKIVGSFIRDDDGEVIVFENKIAAKNFLFTLQYKEDAVNSGFEFVEIDEHEFDE